MVIKQGKKRAPRESVTPSDIIRRDRFGRFNPQGKYYATKAGILRKLPAFRSPSPKPRGYRPQPPIPPSAAPAPRRAEPAPTTPPPPARTKASGRKGAKLSTWFRAAGSMDDERGISFADSYKKGLMEEDVENFEEGYAVPALFFSNQGHLLGRVKFSSEIPLLDLIGMLNDKLQFLGEEAPEFDFRKAYTHWEYKYQVVERIGVTDTVLVEKHDRR
jgi:hypothetical protein